MAKKKMNLIEIGNLGQLTTQKQWKKAMENSNFFLYSEPYSGTCDIESVLMGKEFLRLKSFHKNKLPIICLFSKSGEAIYYTLKNYTFKTLRKVMDKYLTEGYTAKDFVIKASVNDLLINSVVKMEYMNKTHLDAKPAPISGTPVEFKNFDELLNNLIVREVTVMKQEQVDSYQLKRLYELGSASKDQVLLNPSLILDKIQKKIDEIASKVPYLGLVDDQKLNLITKLQLSITSKLNKTKEQYEKVVQVSR